MSQDRKRVTLDEDFAAYQKAINERGGLKLTVYVPGELHCYHYVAKHDAYAAVYAAHPNGEAEFVRYVPHLSFH